MIGAGFSGLDLAHTISKAAKTVTLSHHLKVRPETKFNNNLSQKPDVEYFTETGAVFKDGSSCEFSFIFYCTGFKYSFPFLSVDCGIQSDKNYVRPLFKHCISINHPTIAFIGLLFYNCVTQTADLQSRFCLTYMTQRKNLPSKKEMIEDMESEMKNRWEAGFKTHHAHKMGPRQVKYYEDLAKLADLVPLKPVISKVHLEAIARLPKDIEGFYLDKFRIIDDENYEITKLSSDMLR